MHPFARLGCGVALSLALATPAFAQTYMVVEQVMVRTWRDATPQHYQAMRDGSADTLRLISEARAEIGRGNLPLAQDHVESALSILQGVKSLDPIVLARATVETTRRAPDGQLLAQFQRDIMPLAPTIQNYAGVADVAPARQAMAAAIAAANAGNAAQARSELGRLGASLDPVIEALPVNHTYLALAEAGDVLRARRGAEGDRLLAEAQKDMTLKVVDIRNGN
ncbi:MAG: YfdX family protein [Ferrovibrionaceae bacterium]